MATETTHDDATGSDSDEGLGTVSEIEALGPCKKRVVASVPAAKVRESLDRNYRELTSTVQLPGFRKGRVPRRLLEKRFGDEVAADVKENLVGESFGEVIAQHELRILGTPKFDDVEFDPESDLRYVVEVQVHPEFELPKYRGVEVEPVEVEPVEDKDVDEQIEKLRRQHSTMVPIDPVDATPKDRFRGRYTLVAAASAEGQEPSEGWVPSEDREPEEPACEREDVSFVPAIKRIDAFEIEDLEERVKSWDRSQIGTDAATPLVISGLTVPELFSVESLRGQTVELRFELEETTTSQLPELNGAFAEMLGVDSVDALRTKVREDLESQASDRQERALEEKIVQTILESVTLELPEDLLEDSRRQAEERAEQDGVAAGKTEAEIAEARQAAGKTAADEQARELKEFFVLERIGEKEKIFVTEDEIRRQVSAMAMIYGSSQEQILRMLTESGRLEHIRASIRQGKIRKELRKRARVGSQGSTAQGSTDQGSTDASGDESAQPETGSAAESETRTENA